MTTIEKQDTCGASADMVQVSCCETLSCIKNVAIIKKFLEDNTVDDDDDFIGDIISEELENSIRQCCKWSIVKVVCNYLNVRYSRDVPP